MLSAKHMIKKLKGSGYGPFVGVPCSLLRDLLDHLLQNPAQGYIAATSEGEAMGIAAGFSLSGRIPVVVMQNSGLGNAVNPLTSLQIVYRLPALLLVGWRGEPGILDEPEHIVMGPLTLGLLDLLSIPHEILTGEESELDEQLSRLRKKIEESHGPAALIVRRDTFVKNTGTVFPKVPEEERMTREYAIRTVVESLNGSEVVISSTGKISRELYYKGRESKTNFYMVGSMGCALAIGLGLSRQYPDKKVVILDGDGAVLMKMGSMATVGHYRPTNLIHIIFDNETYDSTGGQPTVSATVRLERVATECGYATADRTIKAEALRECVEMALKTPGPHCILVKVRPGADKNLGRPQLTPEEIKERFMNFLKEE